MSKEWTEGYALEFGRRLCAAMDEAGVSVNALARKTGLSVSTISTYRRGLAVPNLGYAAAIARALGVSLDELARLGDDMGRHGQMDQVRLRCTECGNECYIWRRRSRLKERGHVKHMWCSACRAVRAHVEVRER